jgi:uncharacterized protein
MAITAMFPLGNVLFPSIGLPLRIFEPRYVHMLTECLASDGEFATVLIERGSEVGGGDKRFTTATMAKVLDASEQDDGTWHVMAVGTRRLKVIGWIPDDPYPQADCDEAPDPHEADPVAVAAVISQLRRLLAMSAEANLPTAPATVEFSEDPTFALWQACAVAPLSPMDDYALLCAPSASERITLLSDFLDDEGSVVAHRLSGR